MLPCPSCRTPLGLELDFIIKNPACQCPKCGVIMKFNVDPKIFKNAIAKVRAAQQNIEKLKKQYSNIMTTK